MSKMPTPEEVMSMKKIAQDALKVGNLTIYNRWMYEVMANPTKYPACSVISAADILRNDPQYQV